MGLARGGEVGRERDGTQAGWCAPGVERKRGERGEEGSGGAPGETKRITRDELRTGKGRGHNIWWFLPVDLRDRTTRYSGEPES